MFETVIVIAIIIYSLFMAALAVEYYTDKWKRGLQDAELKEQEREAGPEEQPEPEDVPKRASRPGTEKQSRPGKKKTKPKKPPEKKAPEEKAPEPKPEEDKPPEEWGERKFE
jgi:outer membrane biosynthesis protein TonB